MIRRGPVESLLRPPVELASAAAFGSVGLLALVKPAYLLLTPLAAKSLALGAGLIALVRLKQGMRILKYRRLMTHLPRYQMKMASIPTSRFSLFLGRGFPWTQIHTQRLRDARLPETQSYLRPGWAYRIARRAEIACGHLPGLRWLATVLGSDSSWNPVRKPPPVGGSAEIHGVGMLEGEKNIYLNNYERVGHMLVLGKTRVGKTRIAEMMISQDIQALNVTIVLDPKGDADLMRRTVSEAVRAKRPWYVFHCGYPDLSVGYNPIGTFQRETEVATRVTDPLPGQAQSAPFKAFSWRFVNVIACAMLELGQKPTLEKIRSYISQLDPLFEEYARAYIKKQKIDWKKERARLSEQLGQKKNLPFVLQEKSKEVQLLLTYLEEDGGIHDEHVLQGLYTAMRYSKDFFSRIVASLGPLLDKLTTGALFDLLIPSSDGRRQLDWRRAIRERAVVYIGLDALSDQEVASAVGGAMLSDLTATAGEIYKDGAYGALPGKAQTAPKVSIHADEVNELMTDQFVPLVNKGGGANYQVTAYTQTFSDLETKLGSAAKAKQVLGNFTSLIMFQVKDPVTAKILTEQVPSVQVSSAMVVSGASDSSRPDTDVHFTTSAQERVTKKDVPAIEENELLQLPRGQAFCVINGGQLYKLRFPLPADDMLPLNAVKRLCKREAWKKAA